MKNGFGGAAICMVLGAVLTACAGTKVGTNAGAKKASSVQDRIIVLQHADGTLHEVGVHPMNEETLAVTEGSSI